jgi:RHS repeat-associated protein
VWRWDSDPFGTTAPNENPSGLGEFRYNLRFPGQYYDQETGLHYNYARDYDPSTGRYVESDPIGLGGGTNTYTYVGGDPVSQFDPFGLTQQDIDEMACFARWNNPDIEIPDPEVENLPPYYGYKVAGQLGRWPWSKPVISDRYLAPLNAAGRIDLYNTIVHESWHYSRQPWYDHHRPIREQEAYREADKRTQQVEDLIRKNKLGKCGCSY